VHMPLDSNLTDVAGGHATALIDGAAGSTSYIPGRVNNGLMFDNPLSTAADIDYVSIDYTLTDDGAIALWFTPDSLYNYNSIVANSVDPNDWEMWVYGDGIARARIESDGPVSKPDVIAGQTYHIAWTWDRDIGNPSQATVNLYFDGILIESNTGTWVDPDTTVFIAGGNGNYGANGLFDDFRIYDHTLSATEVSVLSEPLSLRIDRGNGEIFLENNYDFGVTIDSYEITSLSGSLDSMNWYSLEEQDYEGNGAPGTGNGWEEAGGVNAEQLIESYLTGDSIIAGGASISLGNAFAVGGAEDVVLAYHAAGGPTVNNIGTVSYFGATVANADFDADGDVDGADFLTWQLGNGSAGGLAQGDANGDGVVDAADVAVWRSQFGTSSGAGVAQVPEPSSAILISLVLISLATLSRRQRDWIHGSNLGI
jgi:Concanavalin A-like lectin/glucanases superfamily